MGTDTLIFLVSAKCEHVIGEERDTVKMLEKAFTAAKNHYMVLDPDQQLKGALNAVLLKMGDEHPDRPRLETEIGLLGKFNAFIQAAQRGLDVSLPEIPEGYEAIGVMKLWHAAA